MDMVQRKKWKERAFEGDLSDDDDTDTKIGYVDFSRGTFCAVAEAYGSQFWFTRRGAIAENFCEMASEVEIEERIDSVSRWGERARYRDAETILSRCLDGDQFLEFWTRLQESIHGVRPWYESSKDSPGGLLLTALDDSNESANKALASTSPHASDKQKVDAHVDGYDFQALNGVQAIDRLFQRELPVSGPGSSIPTLPMLEEAVPDDIVALAPAPAPAPSPSRKPGERLAAMKGRKGFGTDFFAAAGQTVRDESPRSLLRAHNAQLAKRGLVWRLSQAEPGARPGARAALEAEPAPAPAPAAEAPPPPPGQRAWDRLFAATGAYDDDLDAKELLKLHNSTRGFSYDFPDDIYSDYEEDETQADESRTVASRQSIGSRGSLGSRRSGKSRAERIAEQKAELERQRAEAKAKAEQARIDRELMRQRVAEAGGKWHAFREENGFLREEENWREFM